MFVNYVIDNLPDQMFKTYIHMVIFQLERAQDMTLVRLLPHHAAWRCQIVRDGALWSG